jgi:hypothetical protein
VKAPGAATPLGASAVRPSERTAHPDDVATLRTLLTVIDAVLAAARPLSVLLRQLRQRRTLG